MIIRQHRPKFVDSDEPLKQSSIANEQEALTLPWLVDISNRSRQTLTIEDDCIKCGEWVVAVIIEE